jgi:hypothetical protein
MTAKDFLQQAYRIDQRINSKLEQVSSLRALATKATSTLTDTHVDFTRDVHSMDGVIAKMIDLEAEINADIDCLVDLKREIVTVIKRVQNPEHQTLLELRYLCFKSWDDIAAEMHYSIQNAFKMHGRALAAVAVAVE